MLGDEFNSGNKGADEESIADLMEECHAELCGNSFVMGGNLRLKTSYCGGIMESVVGIFQSLASAQQAVEELVSTGMTEQSIIFLSNEAPGYGEVQATPEENLDAVPTTDAESDGM